MEQKVFQKSFSSSYRSSQDWYARGNLSLLLDNPTFFHLLILEVIGRNFIWDPTGYILRSPMNLAWDKFPMVSQKSGKLKGFWHFDFMPFMNDSENILCWTKCARAGRLFWWQSCENMKRKWGCNKGKCDSDKKFNLGAVKLSCYKFGNCCSY